MRFSWEISREQALEAFWRLVGDSVGCYRRFCCNCGREFYAGRPEARHCSSACRQNAYRQRRRAGAPPCRRRCRLAV